MSKYSPGPWSATDYRVCANVNPNDPPIVVICDTATNKATRTPENAANARLISMAPELLEAAINLRDAILYDPDRDINTTQWTLDLFDEHFGELLGRWEASI